MAVSALWVRPTNEDLSGVCALTGSSCSRAGGALCHLGRDLTSEAVVLCDSVTLTTRCEAVLASSIIVIIEGGLAGARAGTCCSCSVWCLRHGGRMGAGEAPRGRCVLTTSAFVITSKAFLVCQDKD